MAAVARSSVQFCLPALGTTFHEADRSIRSIHSGTQQASWREPDRPLERRGQFKSTASVTFVHSRLQVEADRDTSARAEGTLRGGTLQIDLF
jgi:hypothetical protein